MSSSLPADAARRVAAYLSANASSCRSGPFAIRFDAHSDGPFFNYAVPDPDAVPTPADVAALVGEFRRRSRRPRLEYVDAAAPAVLPVLRASGFQVERRLPVMVHLGTPAAREVPADIDVAAVRDRVDLARAAAVQHEVYEGGRAIDEGDVERLAKIVRQGGAVVLARRRDTGEGLGAGTCTPPLAGAAELAGVAVAEAHRRRGVAGAVTACLVREAARRGVGTLWLTPDGEGPERVYLRAGFVRTTEAVHVSSSA